MCAYTVKFKLLMRNLSEESTEVLKWDDPVGPRTERDFREILEDMKDLAKIEFPRSIKPPAEAGLWKEDPILMVFGDGSREASCAMVYIRWEMQDGQVYCQLVAGKTRVAPKNKIYRSQVWN